TTERPGLSRNVRLERNQKLLHLVVVDIVQIIAPPLYMDDRCVVVVGKVVRNGTAMPRDKALRIDVLISRADFAMAVVERSTDIGAVQRKLLELLDLAGQWIGMQCGGQTEAGQHDDQNDCDDFGLGGHFFSSKRLMVNMSGSESAIERLSAK